MKKLSLLTIMVVVVAGNSALGHSCSSNTTKSTCSPITIATENTAKDIVATAVSAGKFKTLVTALKTANLVTALQSKGPFTVFAPTDAAFAKLPAGTVEKLLKPENRTKLVAILKYHVVPGKIRLGTEAVTTLQGKSLNITSSGAFKVNEAKITATDIETSNGLIHIIDSVLLPVTKQSPRKQASEIIEMAIQRGVPLFNAGQVSACTSIYEVTVQALLNSHTNILTKQERLVLSNAVIDMKKNNDSRKQAWILRYALDKVHSSLAKD